ncbi:Gfo/Idh/MocA family oxidoreductase [Phormidium sp. CLA17]|uniref:Gfo/Idh/MocA family protein n=1 Tax=Leptolyngbya sp. Cla-17 TaxID=2803751 RepID=UPI0014914752|nr:Gfo/Idh/MocA family oxidoreductase [Leptolyngbya sp. Cla-17]MBM0742197.1 Gfo/Idh/MocA family oxidoreductase [Leptolyngbya sp. Cla-17]
MRVGLVGTGHAAKLRAEALQEEPRADLVIVAGNDLERAQAFSQPYGAIACGSWQDLIERADVDLVVIATINRDHGAIAQAALKAGKHVVVEYPLALDIAEAEAAIALAKAHQKLLHVEHIELLGGVHQALKASLALIGDPFFARYITLKPERPAPQRWSYTLQDFGFPLVGALSRLHRLIDLFGEVASVTCQAQFFHSSPSSPYYSTCLCTAHLRFKSGLLAEVTYGKGEALWQAKRTFEVQGKTGALIFEGEQGTLIRAEGTEAIAIGSRRGLFAKDTALVLDHLTIGTPLYITPEASLYTLKVADAARQSAATGNAVKIDTA